MNYILPLSTYTVLFNVIRSQGHLRLIVTFGPHATLTRCQNPIRIERVLDILVQPQQCMVIEIIGLCDLIHQSNMSAEFTPPVLGKLFYQGAYKPLATFAHIFVFTVEYDAYNVI